MNLSAIWKKHARVRKRPQNSTSPKNKCYLRFLKNSPVLLINNIHTVTKLCRIESHVCVTYKNIYSLLIVNIFTTKNLLTKRQK